MLDGVVVGRWKISCNYYIERLPNVDLEFVNYYRNGDYKMINLSAKIFAGIIIGISVSGVAFAGPFGLEKGLSLQSIGGNPQQVAPGKYKVITVPKPHSAFDYYILQIGPKSGLCWIKAIGKDSRTSVYGIELKGSFNDMRAKLQEIYGPSQTTDALLPGSIWNEPKDWMMALVKKERVLLSMWDAKSNASLPSDILSVGLVAKPQGTEKGYLTLEYSFTNEKECDREIAKKEDSAL